MTNAELIQKIRKEIINRIDKRHLSAQAKNELVSILSFLDTLEESDFPTTDEEMEAFLASHPKVEVPDKYKTPDWLYKELEQEPEVDDIFKKWGTTEEEYLAKSMDKVRLEMELATYLQDWQDDEEIGLHFSTDFGDVQIELDDIRDLARHFYEFGCRRAAEMYDDIEYNRQMAEEKQPVEGLDENYCPYKTTVEGILKMFNSYSITTDKSDFIDNIRVKCKDAVEYDKLFPKSCQEKEQPASEGLEEEIDKEIAKLFLTPTHNSLVNFARHFAEWKKAKMLEGAVEGVAEELYNDGEIHCTVGVGTYFKPGEEVYVIKKEDEK